MARPVTPDRIYAEKRRTDEPLVGTDKPVSSSSADPPTPSVSVVVPTRDRPERIMALVKVLLAEDAVNDIVVVTGTDDASVPGLVDLERTRPELHLVTLDPAPSAATARLAGAQRATGDIVLLIDDDVLPEPGIVDIHARYHQQREDIVVAGAMPVRLPSSRGPGEAATRLYAEEWERCWRDNHDEPLNALWMGNVSLRRTDFIKAELASDGWDGSYHEDADLGLRLAAAGLTGVAADDARAAHLQSRTLGDVVRDARRQVQGLNRLRSRHPAQYGQLPSYMVEPAWLFRVSGLLANPVAAGVFVACGGFVERASGFLHLWSIETATVRLVRRMISMSVVHQLGPTPGPRRAA